MYNHPVANVQSAYVDVLSLFQKYPRAVIGKGKMTFAYVGSMTEYLLKKSRILSADRQISERQKIALGVGIAIPAITCYAYALHYMTHRKLENN
jgi:hypothetical protein